jgi:hypothetical protein
MSTEDTPRRYPAARQYAGTAAIAGALGVDTRTVSKWISRYPPDSKHPFPAPDAAIGDVLGWDPTRLPEIAAWRAGMPGQGSDGGRPRRQPE